MGLYKAIALDAFAVLSAIFFSYAYRNFLDGSTGVRLPILALSVFCIFSVLSVLLIRSFRERLLIVFLETIGFFAFFYDVSLEVLLPTALLLFFFLLWGEIAARQEIAGLMHVGFFRVSKLQLRRVVTGLIVMTIVLYLPQWQNSDLLISRDTFRIFYDWAGGIVRSFNSDIDYTSSFENLATSIIRADLKNDPTFQNLSDADKNSLVDAKVNQISNELSQYTGVPIIPIESADQVLHKLLTNYIREWRNSYGLWFLTGAGIVLFLTIQGIGIIFQWLAIGMAFILYQLLLAFNVIHISGETRTRETIEFS